jgi:hypothetical protein
MDLAKKQKSPNFTTFQYFPTKKQNSPKHKHTPMKIHIPLPYPAIEAF